MKQVYTSICFFVLLLTGTCQVSSAQLVPGDIAFTGYHATPNSPQSDAFSFVLLKNMTARTVIHFTENAWGNNGVFRTGENTVSFTLGAARNSGTEIVISGPPSGTATAVLRGGGSAGTCSGNMLSLAVTGDQVIAYQSATVGVAPFTFISAILMNVYIGGTDPSITDATNWDNLPAASQTANSSFKPTGLTTGVNAIWIGTQNVAASERNNARFNCVTAIAGGANLSTVAGIRTACNNPAFWDSEAAVSGAIPSWPLPSSCALASTLPLKLLSFDAKKLTSSILLEWKTSDQLNFDRFEIERRYDNGSFGTIATIQGLPSQGVISYGFTDTALSHNTTPHFYYRLKMVDADGTYTYSTIVSIRNSYDSPLTISLLQNPATGDLLEFTINSKEKIAVTLQVRHITGQEAVVRNMVVQAGENRVRLPFKSAAGLYMLTVTSSDGKRQTLKVIKK